MIDNTQDSKEQTILESFKVQVSDMWSKLASHLGIWLTHIERDRSELRPSCSLSVLNNRHISVAHSSNSSDNIHCVLTTPHMSPSSRKPVFSFRKSRKTEKKKKSAKVGDGVSNKKVDVNCLKPVTGAVGDLSSCMEPMVQSWHSTINTQRNIFSRLRPSRSRSSNLGCLLYSKSDRCCSRVYEPRSAITTLDDSRSCSVNRRRRPRSTHLDPNTLSLSPSQDIPVQDVNVFYRKIEKLGEGSYAVVYKSESRNDGTIVALKEIKLHSQEGLPFTAIREASLLRALRHSNIVTLHDIVHEENALVFVFEYMKTDLNKYLEAFPNGLDSIQVKLFLFQLLRGLAFCHSKKILHRDLKPQNILLNENGELKLADFGLARAKSVPSRTYSHEVVTLWYRPPDVLLGSTNYSTSLDLWGVGCIFAEMCTGCALFPGTRDVVDQLDRIFSIRGMPDPAKWPEVKDLPNYTPTLYPPYHEVAWNNVHSGLVKLKNGQSLLSHLLQLNPCERISASSAMMHPYFASLPSKIHLLPPTVSIYSISEVREAFNG